MYFGTLNYKALIHYVIAAVDSCITSIIKVEKKVFYRSLNVCLRFKSEMSYLHLSRFSKQSSIESISFPLKRNVTDINKQNGNKLRDISGLEFIFKSINKQANKQWFRRCNHKSSDEIFFCSLTETMTNSDLCIQIHSFSFCFIQRDLDHNSFYQQFRFEESAFNLILF